MRKTAVKLQHIKSPQSVADTLVKMSPSRVGASAFRNAQSASKSKTFREKFWPGLERAYKRTPVHDVRDADAYRSAGAGAANARAKAMLKDTFVDSRHVTDFARSINKHRGVLDVGVAAQRKLLA